MKAFLCGVGLFLFLAVPCAAQKGAENQLALPTSVHAVVKPKPPSGEVLSLLGCTCAADERGRHSFDCRIGAVVWKKKMVYYKGIDSEGREDPIRLGRRDYYWALADVMEKRFVPSMKKKADPDFPDLGRLPNESVLIRADSMTPFEGVIRIFEVAAREGIKIWKFDLAVTEQAIGKSAPKEGVLRFSFPKSSQFRQAGPQVLDCVVRVIRPGTLELTPVKGGGVVKSYNGRVLQVSLGEEPFKIRSGFDEDADGLWDDFAPMGIALKLLKRKDGKDLVDIKPEEVSVVVDPQRGVVCSDVVAVLDALMEEGFSEISFTWPGLDYAKSRRGDEK